LASPGTLVADIRNHGKCRDVSSQDARDPVNYRRLPCEEAGRNGWH
jgi:hypothetical protein